MATKLERNKKKILDYIKDSDPYIPLEDTRFYKNSLLISYSGIGPTEFEEIRGLYNWMLDENMVLKTPDVEETFLIVGKSNKTLLRIKLDS